MLNFKQYITLPRVDSHVHLFNYTEPIKYPFDFDKCIGFMDIEYDVDGDAVKAYDDFVKNHYDESKHILLATAKTPEEIEKIYNNHQGIIMGFGELKLYDTYQDKKVPYKKISILRSVCELSSKNGGLPIFVHWEFTDDKSVRYFENVLKSYPNIPIFLCHCGMNGQNDDFAYGHCQRLHHAYSNLILDISYKALDYFEKCPLKLYNLVLDRMTVGSDLNNKIFGPNHSEKEIILIKTKVDYLRTFIPSDQVPTNMFTLLP